MNLARREFYSNYVKVNSCNSRNLCIAVNTLLKPQTHIVISDSSK